MNVYLITLIATTCNIGTILCIKKCKQALGAGASVFPWLLGIAVSILATQYLLLWADVKGASLGLAVSVVIVSVMIAAAFTDIHPETGRLAFLSVKTMPIASLVGYGLAVLGVLLVGWSQ